MVENETIKEQERYRLQRPAAMGPDELLVEEAAELAAVTVGRIHQLLREGVVDSRHVKAAGARYIYAVSLPSLKSYIANRSNRRPKTKETDCPGRTSPAYAHA